MVNTALAQAVFYGSECYSIIGPSQSVTFGDSAVLWASFYHLMFRKDQTGMKRRELLTHLQAIVDLFQVSINYYSASKKAALGYSLKRLQVSRPI